MQCKELWEKYKSFRSLLIRHLLRNRLLFKVIRRPNYFVHFLMNLNISLVSLSFCFSLTIIIYVAEHYTNFQGLGKTLEERSKAESIISWANGTLLRLLNVLLCFYKLGVKVCIISFERPVNYLCDAWHVFPPKYEAWTHFNRS